MKSQAENQRDKGKGEDSPHTSDSEELQLPTKTEIYANWLSRPSFHPDKLLFYASPIAADQAENFAKKYLPGYSTLIPSFNPAEWADAWAFSEDEEVQNAFWKIASEAFAEVAAGTVYVLLPDGIGEEANWNEKSLWNTELPILKASPTVGEIIRINANPPHAKSYIKGSN